MKTKNIFIWGLVIVGVGVGGYFVYRKIRTSSNSAEKNNRKIKIIKNKNTDGLEVETEETNDNFIDNEGLF